ncbi:hypothetical protein I6F66_09995 [Pseudoalteromonas sp. NZS100_1]|uniref:hypothetical protein n=1 Tax=Pseudoalteromonas sp. NZS100_1 TaxID=2792073 RepID=UPI0018CDFF5D|nr:hypothetical protein [Pseudoalteromonas sp. NZS100_1]MBH0012426.1 hypothetical protein [Pseudoalteromonas sp. NZS100_1]
MVHIQQTKECIMCFSSIDSRAKKCPQCTSLQAKYSNLENNPIIIGALALSIVGIFGFVFYQNIYVAGLEEQAQKNLTANVSQISTKNETDGLYVACIGQIKNESDFSFKNIKFKVDFLSEQNALVDTLSITDEDLIIANGLTNFRVRGIAQKSATSYNKCQVFITDAWAYK